MSAHNMTKEKFIVRLSMDNGRSQECRVRLPKEISRDFQLRPKDLVEVKIEGNHIVITPMKLSPKVEEN